MELSEIVREDDRWLLWLVSRMMVGTSYCVGVAHER